MDSLKIAMLQLAPTDSLVGNLHKGLEQCRQAKAMGADIALFPEMWSVGYSIPLDPAHLASTAIPIHGSFTHDFCTLARELDMAIGVTLLEQHKPLPRNTICLIDRHGKIALTYAKVHTCDFGDECRLDAGDGFAVTELDTAHGAVMVGAMICYDREFPESARLLMLMGAEVILVPNACPMEINRLCQLRSRAYENMVGVATVNYPTGSSGCNGHSTAFDGIAYDPTDGSSRDMLVAEAGECEGIYLADFPIDALRAYRSSEVHGNAYRHPAKYGLLVSEEINEPFVRDDYRR